MRRMTIKQYIYNNGQKCIFCGREDLRGDSTEISSGQAAQSVTCGICGASWTDVYILNNVVNIEKPEKGGK